MIPDEPPEDNANAVILPGIIDPGSNAVDDDYDGIEYGLDTSDTSNTFSGTLYTANATSNVSYKMDYRWFFSSNTTYRPDLAVISSLLSATAYETSHINITNGGSLTTTNSNVMNLWMVFHGMSTINSYTLTNSDNHLSQMFIGHRTVSYNNTEKTIVCVVIRGTNGTIEEWSSNFDVGPSTSDHNEWTTEHNHKGFDITANRLNALLTSYLSTYCAGEAVTLWITGHSRGGALANILAAKRVDAGNQVFAYTFAAPATTTLPTAGSLTKYQCIFNIINEDDLVPELPLSHWGFRRYGKDKPASIEDSYSNQWQNLIGTDETYTSNQSSMKNNVIPAFEGIADNRNECYTYRTGGYILGSLTHPTASSAALAAEAHIAGYPENMQPYCSWTPTGSAEYYGYVVNQQPAFFMQMIAAKMGGEITDDEFLLYNVAVYLDNAKLNIMYFAKLGYMTHPHYPESYYLLATKVTE